MFSALPRLSVIFVRTLLRSHKTLRNLLVISRKLYVVQKEAGVLTVLWVEAESERNFLIIVIVLLWPHRLGKQQFLKCCY